MTTLRIETPRAFLPLLSPSRYKGAHGGRGSGKSHFFAELLIERCLMSETRAVCVREIQKSLDGSVKQLLEDKIKALGVSSRFRVLNTHIECDNGGLIIFQGMQNHTSDSIKSLEGYDVAWVEEAQSMSQRSLDLLRPTIRKPGSELWFSWNPNKPTDPIDVLLRGENPPRDAVVIEVNYHDNPWLPDELKQEMEGDRERDPDKYAWVWLGGYQGRSEARVFRNWRMEAFVTPHDAVLRFGADWGFAVDPTVLVRGWTQGRKLYIDYEAYEVGCENDYLPFLFGGVTNPKLIAANRQAFESLSESQKLKWKGVPMATEYRITADSARPELVSYMRRHGFSKIIPAVKGMGSIEDGITFLQSFDIIVHPRCEHVIQELSAYSYKVDKMTDEVLPVLEDKDNHTIDALRYALEGLRRAGKPSAEALEQKPIDRYAKLREKQDQQEFY